jgi:hypothetical protein
MKYNPTENHLRAILPVFALAAMAGCSTTGIDPKHCKLTAPTLQQPTVAVLPFESPDYKQLKPNERMIRDFERNYLPARLVEALRGTSGIASAYFSPAPTPAADLNVKASIKKSDGKMTVIGVDLLSANGTRVSTQTFSINTTSAEFKKMPDPAGRIWPQIAAAIVKTKQKPGEYAVARVIGYSGDKEIIVTDQKATVATEGAGAERQGMLEPVTAKMMPRAKLADQIYIAWQQEATPLVEQRSSEKSMETISFVTALVGGAASGVGAAMGDTSTAQLGMQGAMMAATNAGIAAGKIEEINKTLETTSQGLIWHQGQPTSVRVFGEVYKFSGTLESQQAELRKVVQTHVTKSPEELQATPAPPAKSKKRNLAAANP